MRRLPEAGRARRWIGPALGLALVVVPACGGGGSVGRGPVGPLTEMEQIRVAPGAREGAELAPQAYGHAEEERALAKRAESAGDDTGAALHAERAIAAYHHALVLSRLARAERDAEGASKTLADAGEQTRKLAMSRADVEREAEELQKQVQIAREMLLPAPSGPADPQRDAARRVAARALATQARLLCGSARLLASDAQGLGEAEQELEELEKKLDATQAAAAPAPIDAAARARAGCLRLLTRARRASDDGATGKADVLLAELSASGGPDTTATGGVPSRWDPSRDERGVVVTLRGLFAGGLATTLTSETDAKLKELGRVAAAHPGFAIQVVVHDATPPSAAEAAADAQRADAIVKALVAAGAPAGKVKGETAGARAPVVDPTDTAHRARNARVEIVFVSPGN